MKSPDNVLLGIAFLLLAGVILYNVFTAQPEPDGFSNETTAPGSVVVQRETAGSGSDSSETGTTENGDSEAKPEAVTPDVFKININTATREELETLKGIGPAKADAIVSYREANGPFSAVEDLLNVSGIGEKTLMSIMDNITV